MGQMEKISFLGMEQMRIADGTATNDVFGATKQTGHITSA